MALLENLNNLNPFNQQGGYGVVNPGGKAPKKHSNLKEALNSKVFKWILIGAALFIILLIVLLVCVAMLQDLRQKPITLSEQLVARFTTTIDVIDDYTDEMRSTAMRSHATTLRESINATNSSLVTYLETNYGYDQGSAEDSSAWAEEAEIAEVLRTELENARLNGILDRTYASEMMAFIGEVIGIESEIIERSDSAELDGILSNSTSSLENISNGLEELQVSNRTPADFQALALLKL